MARCESAAASARASESLVALPKMCGIWTLIRALGYRDRRTVNTLESVEEHRTVGLAQDVRPNFYDQVGSNADQVLIECRMVELAERETVRNLRFSARIGVGKDVRCIEQFTVAQAA